MDSTKAELYHCKYIQYVRKKGWILDILPSSDPVKLTEFPLEGSQDLPCLPDPHFSSTSSWTLKPEWVIILQVPNTTDRASEVSRVYLFTTFSSVDPTGVRNRERFQKKISMSLPKSNGSRDLSRHSSDPPVELDVSQFIFKLFEVFSFAYPISEVRKPFEWRNSDNSELVVPRKSRSRWSASETIANELLETFDKTQTFEETPYCEFSHARKLVQRHRSIFYCLWLNFRNQCVVIISRTKPRRSWRLTKKCRLMIVVERSLSTVFKAANLSNNFFRQPIHVESWSVKTQLYYHHNRTKHIHSCRESAGEEENDEAWRKGNMSDIRNYIIWYDLA